MKPVGSLSKLRIRLFGTVTVHIDGEPIRKRRTRSGDWLLSLLVLRRGKPVEREWLAHTLWPESGQAVARGNLRHCLSDLRKSLGEEAGRLTAPSSTTLRLDMSGVDVDVFDFDATTEANSNADMPRAIAYYQSPLLKDCHAPWADDEREHRRTRYMAALDTLSVRAENVGNRALALDYLQRLFDLDPLQEGVARRLMVVLAAMGDCQGAVSLYRDLRARLSRIIGSEPEIETNTLYHEFRVAARKHRIQLRNGAASETVTHRFGYVPALLVPLIGRDRAIYDVLTCLDRSRMVTLTGAPGIGKTQLGLSVAVEAWPDYPDGIWFVDLSGSTGRREIVEEILGVLGQGGVDSANEEVLLRLLRTKRLLLVLDNCEHLLSACASMARRILDDCDAAKILSTSRQSLGMTGEWVYKVAPLVLPLEFSHTLVAGAEPEAELEGLLSHGAIELFVTRAARSSGAFRLTVGNASYVVQICEQLDGVPLAIELAAAWTRSLSVQEISTRLRDALSLLVGGDTTGPVRHVSLEAALDWSYALLGEDERRLWCELSIFVSGWSLEAMETVCASSGYTRPLVHLQDRLVDASIVGYLHHDGVDRYHLLEAQHQYGARKLGGAPARQAALRHRAYFVEWAEAATSHLTGPDQGVWLERMARERGNLRRALENAREMQAGTVGLRLAGALWRFWLARGECETGQTWLESFLAIGKNAPPLLRLTAVGAAGNLAYRRADYMVARAHFTSHLQLARELKRPHAVASALGNLGNIASDESQFCEARGFYEQSLSGFRALNDSSGVAFALGNLANAIGRGGTPLLAYPYHEESIAILRASGDVINLALALANFAETKLQAEEHSATAEPLVESLKLSYQIDHVRNEVRCLLLALRIAVEQSHLESAAIVLGRIERIKVLAEMPVAAPVRDRFEENRATILAALGPQVFAQAHGQGAVMAAEQIMEVVEGIGV